MTWLTQGEEWIHGNLSFKKVFHSSLKAYILIISSFRKDEVFFVYSFHFLRKSFLVLKLIEFP